GELLCESEARELEQAVAATLPVFRDGLASEGLRQERRALRLRVRDAALEWPDSETAVLNFRLTAGAYATAVLRELLDAPD
ncbi:MAG: tRNA pseudouridine(13) synthase TruD, partial [Candidatus Competibacter sp.]|nr:tRNA pseudouridine(13) synthase TruD [Candidatus Competibacter sp.]